MGLSYYVYEWSDDYSLVVAVPEDQLFVPKQTVDFIEANEAYLYWTGYELHERLKNGQMRQVPIGRVMVMDHYSNPTKKSYFLSSFRNMPAHRNEAQCGKFSYNIPQVVEPSHDYSHEHWKNLQEGAEEFIKPTEEGDRK